MTDPATSKPDEYDDRFLVSDSFGRVTPPPKRKAKRPVAEPPLEKTARPVINRRNRQRGRTAETKWAAMIHGRRIGTLGREDVDDGFRLFEVKNRKLPAWIRGAFAQVEKASGDKLRYVVIHHLEKSGTSAEWYVIQRASQFIDTAGYGNYEPK